MFLFNCVMMALPVIFLVASAIIAVKMYERGRSKKQSVLMQIFSFAAVFAICLICPIVANAATGDAGASSSDLADGLSYIGAALSTRYRLLRRRYRGR